MEHAAGQLLDSGNDRRSGFAWTARARHLRRGPVCRYARGTSYDCGAHVAVTALKRGAKLVVAIEPAPENIECLRRNFSTEIEKGKVIIYPKGVWNKDDFLPMHLKIILLAIALCSTSIRAAGCPVAADDHRQNCRRSRRFLASISSRWTSRALKCKRFRALRIRWLVINRGCLSLQSI